MVTLFLALALVRYRRGPTQEINFRNQPGWSVEEYRASQNQFELLLFSTQPPGKKHSTLCQLLGAPNDFDAPGRDSGPAGELRLVSANSRLPAVFSNFFCPSAVLLGHTQTNRDESAIWWKISAAPSGSYAVLAEYESSEAITCS